MIFNTEQSASFIRACKALAKLTSRIFAGGQSTPEHDIDVQAAIDLAIREAIVLEKMRCEFDTLTIPLWDCPELVAGRIYCVCVECQIQSDIRRTITDVHWNGTEFCRIEICGDDVYWVPLEPFEVIVAWMLATEIPPYEGPAREMKGDSK